MMYINRTLSFSVKNHKFLILMLLLLQAVLLTACSSDHENITEKKSKMIQSTSQTIQGTTKEQTPTAIKSLKNIKTENIYAIGRTCDNQYYVEYEEDTKNNLGIWKEADQEAIKNVQAYESFGYTIEDLSKVTGGYYKVQTTGSMRLSAWDPTFKSLFQIDFKDRQPEAITCVKNFSEMVYAQADEKQIFIYTNDTKTKSNEKLIKTIEIGIRISGIQDMLSFDDEHLLLQTLSLREGTKNYTGFYMLNISTGDMKKIIDIEDDQLGLNINTQNNRIVAYDVADMSKSRGVYVFDIDGNYQYIPYQSQKEMKGTLMPENEYLVTTAYAPDKDNQSLLRINLYDVNTGKLHAYIDDLVAADDMETGGILAFKNGKVKVLIRTDQKTYLREYQLLNDKE